MILACRRNSALLSLSGGKQFPVGFRSRQTECACAKNVRKTP